jgi:hypothetical protein
MGHFPRQLDEVYPAVMNRAQRTFRLLVAGVIAVAAQAHVGSPDVYLDGKAGPYQLFVTVRPPQVIPGVAALEIRSESPGVQQIRAVPVPIAGPGAKFAPVADSLRRSKEDPQFFTGSLWIMAPGSWQVRISASGAKGEGTISIPVPSAALRTKRMQAGIGTILSLLGLFLVGGMVAIAGASVREAKLAAGEQPSMAAKKKARLAMCIAGLVLLGVLWGGNAWWNSEAQNYGQTVYRPTQMHAGLDGSGTLNLQLVDSGWLAPPAAKGRPRRFSFLLFRHDTDDLVPDHDHLMHLYAIREPGLDAVYHLHPEQTGPGAFRLQLPAMQAGPYRLYADIVHSNGFPETPVAEATIPAGLPSRPLSGDDASATAIDWMHSNTSKSFTLPDGYRMDWIRDDKPLRAREGKSFRFRLVDQQGKAPKDMQLYMGMLGHAAFVKTDETVFAHIHPMGTASMAALSLAEGAGTQAAAGDMSGPAMNMKAPDMKDMHMNGMPDMDMGPSSLPNEVSFPYGFPAPGRYRIFVQMKHGHTVETGVFDATVQ